MLGIYLSADAGGMLDAKLVGAARGDCLGRCVSLLLSRNARNAGIARGTLCDFSPLGDERLPDGTDIVYLGCGHPERFAQALSENQCLAAGLRQHVCIGQRLYAEGGGLAYLCEQIELADGRRFAMSGVLPAIGAKIADAAVRYPTRWSCGIRIAPAKLRIGSVYRFQYEFGLSNH